MALGGSIGSATIGITADTSALKRSIESGLSSAFKKAAVAASAAFAGAGIGSAINKAAQFDKVIRLAGMTADATAEQVKMLGDTALKMGANSQFGAQGAADAMLELAKGGLTVAQIKAGALAGTMTLASAGGIELGAAATYMANALNVFGLDASKASSVAAAFAGGANASTASVESLGVAMGQAALSARNAGLTLQETTGVLAAFDQAGLKGSDAGTSLRTMLMRLIPTTAEANDKMKQMGLSFIDAKGNFLPIRDIAQQLQDKFKGLTEAQKSSRLSTIFGADAQRAANELMNLGAKGIDKYTKATSDQTAAEKLAAEQTAGAAGAFKKFHSAVDALQIQFGLHLLPKITAVTTAFTDLINNIAPKIDGFFASAGAAVATLREPLANIGTQAKAAFDVVWPAIQQFIDRVIAAGPGIANFFASIAPFYGPAVLAIGLLVDGAGLLITAFGHLGDFFAQHSTVVGALATVVGALVVGFTALSVITGIVTAVSGGLVTAFWAINAAMAANPVGAIIVALAALAAGFIYAWKKSETFREVVAAAVNGLTTVIAGVVKMWANLILGFWEGVLSAIAAIPFAEKVIPGLKTAKNAVHDFRVGVNAEIDSIKTSIHIVATADASQAVNQLKMLQAAQAAAAGKLIGPIIPGTTRPTVANGFGTVSAPKVNLSGSATGGGGVTPSGSTGYEGKEKKAAADAAKKAAAAAKKAAQKARDAADKAAGKQISARTFVDTITGGQDQIKSAFDKLLEQIKAGNKPKLAAYVKSVQKDLLAVGVKRDKISESLTLAKDKLSELRKESADYSKSVRDAILETGNIATHNVITFTGIRNSLRHAVRQANEFKSAIASLTAAGLNKDSLQDLIAAGPEAGLKAARTLMQGGAAGIKEVNSLTAQLTAAGTTMGDQTAATFYKAGISAAEGLVKGLQSQEAALNKQMDRMASRMVTTLRKQLGIHSPSRVFAGIGGNIGAGLARGIDASRGRVGAAAGRMGMTTINHFGGISVSGLADPVQMERGGIMTAHAIADTLARQQATANLAGMG
jgi:TP901 family phage tail tape measure protein